MASTKSLCLVSLVCKGLLQLKIYTTISTYVLDCSRNYFFFFILEISKFVQYRLQPIFSGCHHTTNGKTQQWPFYGTKDHRFSSLFTQNRRWYTKNILDTADCNLGNDKLRAKFKPNILTIHAYY